MATVIYSITSDDFANDNGARAFPTKAEAMKVARTLEGPWTLQRITIGEMPRRELFCALLNNEGYAAEQEDVAEGGW